MKYRVLLLDVDGVLVAQHELFSYSYADKHGYDRRDFDRFFKEYHDNVLRGKTTYKQSVIENNHIWRWDKDPDTLMKEWFSFGMEENVDMDLIDVALAAKKHGIKVYLATNQDKDRATFLKERFSEILNGAFISSDFGALKDEPPFFLHVIAALKREIPHLKSEDILFFDDVPENVEAARKAGISSFIYEGANQVRDLLGP